MKEPLYVLYDGNCGLCRRTLRRLVALDWLRRLTPLDARDRAEIERHGLGWLSGDALAKDLHAVTAKKAWRGYEAYRKIARHLPALWVFWPFLWLWPITWFGRRLYRHAADTRSFIS